MEFAEIDTEAANDERLLSILCAVDHEFPCIGRYFRSGAHRRQVIASALAPAIKARGNDRNVALARLGATAPDANTETLLAAAGRAICEERGSNLIRRAYGECPHGFIGALERCGSTAHSKGFYLDLYRVFHLPENRHIARALRHESHVHPRLLRTAMTLPAYLCTTNFLTAVCRYDAGEFVAAVELILQVCPSVTPAALSESIPTGDDVSVPNWISKWIGRAALPEGPIADDELMIPVRSVAEMEALGREMRNCLRTKSVKALSGANSYLRATVNDAPYAIELEKSGQEWSLSGIYATKNRPVPTDVEENLSARLAARGIMPDRSDRAVTDRWEPIRRALRHAPLVDEDFDPVWVE